MYMRAFFWGISIAASACLFLLSGTAHAQDQKLTLSVTPPLFQLNLHPGELWKSSLKIINNNAYELTLYAAVHNFAPQGEAGQGVFLPREEGFNPEGPTLANWLDVTSLPIVIPPEQSIEIPIAVVIPKDAPPGGHFAAILVGTRPPEGSGSSFVRTSQVVTSLFFTRIAGEVREEASIREFSVAHLFKDTPAADFILRFANTGNVHVRPQGTISIYNMWGKERGVIPINQKSEFGNVLPSSIRRFEFSWKGEQSLADIGRYTAIVTLTYGQDARQNVHQEAYFWVIPVKGLLMTLGVVGAFVLFMIWAVRRYIRRALYLAGYDASASPSADRESVPRKARLAQRDLARPIREGVLDLRRQVKVRDGEISSVDSLWRYVQAYRYFFAALLCALCFGVIAYLYFQDVLQGEKSYEVIVERGDADVVLSPHEVEQQVSGAKGGTE